MIRFEKKRDEASLQQQQRIVIISYVAELGQTTASLGGKKQLLRCRESCIARLQHCAAVLGKEIVIDLF